VKSAGTPGRKGAGPSQRRSAGSAESRPERSTGPRAAGASRPGADRTRPGRTATPAGKRSTGTPTRRTYGTAGKRTAPAPDRRRTAAPPAAAAEPMRLNKYIANSGLCARREADELIKNGYITVNGVKVTDMGVKVKPSDNVEYKGKKISPEKKVYILLNKPKGYVTTVKDPHAPDTVLDLVRDATGERIYPVGRLDKSTTGILLLTNDGDLAGRLTHPKYEVRKVYHVFTDKEVTRHDMEKIVEGVELEDGTVSADAISYPDPDDHMQVGLEIHSGQNRVVRRIFEKLGYNVRKLDRVSFAGLTKKNLQRGKWRFLTLKEVSMLKRGIYK
jgi:23S rRNA pseudouridine2605 synthase